MSSEMHHLLQRLKAEGAPDPGQDALHHWMKAVHALYRNLERWIEPLVDARVAAYSGRMEQNTGEPAHGRMRFERPAFTIHVKKVRFVFRPAGIGHLDLQVLGHEAPKPFQVTLTGDGTWELGVDPDSVRVPLTDESLAKFINRWV